MGNFGVGEMLFIGVIALLLFGPRRLPDISRTVGKAVREFKQATNGLTQDFRSEWAAVSDLHPHVAPSGTAASVTSAIPAPAVPVAPQVPVASADGADVAERPERAS